MPSHSRDPRDSLAPISTQATDFAARWQTSSPNRQRVNLPTIQPSKFLPFWPWLAAALSGILLALCFPRWDQGRLCWIALTPLGAATFASEGRWRRAALGYLAGVIFIAGTFWWLGFSLAELYRNSFLLSIPALLALYMGLYLAFWAWFLGEARTALDAGKNFGTSWRNLAIGAL